MKPTALNIIKKLREAGFESYFAGGCVRDLLLNVEPKDYDIVTNALPEQIEALFEHSIAIGKQFGVIIIVEDGHHFEIATFRSDASYSDGRRPDAILFTNAEEDAKRRDFTINGLFYDPLTDKILDFIGGQKDLQEHLIRFIGEPEERILEDHLRILRAVRFKNQLQFQYEPTTYHALQKHAELVIDKVSKERLGDELNKILSCAKPSQAFEELSHLGILKVIFPELEAMHGIAQPYEFHHEGDVWTHTMQALDSLPKTASLRLRWATLLHDSGKPETYKLEERIRFDSHCQASASITQTVLKRFKMSRKFTEEIQWLVVHHMMMVPLAEMNEGRKMHWFLHPLFPDLLGVFEADARGTTPTDLSLYDQILKLYQEAKNKMPHEPKPLLTGNEIAETLNLKPGPKIGEILADLRHEQLSGNLDNKTEALTWLKKKS